MFGVSANSGASGIYGTNTAGGFGVAGRTGGLQSGVWGDNIGGGNGVYGTAANSGASGVFGYNGAGGFGVAGRGTGKQAAIWGDNVSSGPGALATSSRGTGLIARGAGYGASLSGGSVGLHVDGVNDGMRRPRRAAKNHPCTRTMKARTGEMASSAPHRSGLEFMVP